MHGFKSMTLTEASIASTGHVSAMSTHAQSVWSGAGPAGPHAGLGSLCFSFRHTELGSTVYRHMFFIQQPKSNLKHLLPALLTYAHMVYIHRWRTRYVRTGINCSVWASQVAQW